MSGKNWWEESDGRLVVDDVNEAALELHTEVVRLRANAEHWAYQAGRLQGEVESLTGLLAAHDPGLFARQERDDQ